MWRMANMNFLRPVLLLTTALIVTACSGISSLENRAQVMMGRSQAELIEAMMSRPDSEGSRLCWNQYDQELVEVYHPAEYYEETEEHEDRRETTYKSRSCYREAYIENRTIEHVLEVQASCPGGRVTELSIFLNNRSFPVSQLWASKNRAELDWNAAVAEDDLSLVQRLESVNPKLASKPYRVRACLQAARYGSDKVLGYYLGSGWVNLDDRGEIAVPAGACDGETTAHYTLVTKSVREALRTSSHSGLRADLAKRGITY